MTEAPLQLDESDLLVQPKNQTRFQNLLIQKTEQLKQTGWLYFVTL